MSFFGLPEAAVDIAQEKKDAAGERPMASRDPGRGPVSFSGIGNFANLWVGRWSARSSS